MKSIKKDTYDYSGWYDWNDFIEEDFGGDLNEY